MTRSLATRLVKLEAILSAKESKETGVIGERFSGTSVETIDGIAHLRREEPPGGFAAFARKQQTALQTEIAILLADF